MGFVERRYLRGGGMITKLLHRALLVMVVVLAMLVLAADMAHAAEGDTIPHGGYNTATDACFQCHDAHSAQGDYVLSRMPTVTGMCGSCHTLYQELIPLEGLLQSSTDPVWVTKFDGDQAGLTDYGGAPDSTDPNIVSQGSRPGQSSVLNFNPGYSGLEAPVPGWALAEEDPANQVGTGAPFEAYQKPLVNSNGSDGRYGHRLGTSFSQGETVDHADGVTDSLDYIPGGSGRLTAIATPSVADSADEIGVEYMLPTASVGQFPVSLNGGLYCASCHSPHGQFSGAGVEGASDYSNTIDPEINDKLLAKAPNHSATAADLGTEDAEWVTDGAEWCGKCHDDRVSNTVGEEPHNHPDFACLQCHGNEAVLYEGNPEYGEPHLDFPHTSANPNLLSMEPDGLCHVCHGPGAMPVP